MWRCQRTTVLYSFSISLQLLRDPSFPYYDPVYLYRCLLAALCLSALSDPALPHVGIDTAPVDAPLDYSETSDTQRFVLLSSSGPYWHVYNEGGLFAFTMDTSHHMRYRDTLIPECPEEEGA